MAYTMRPVCRARFAIRVPQSAPPYLRPYLVAMLARSNSALSDRIARLSAEATGELAGEIHRRQALGDW